VKTSVFCHFFYSSFSEASGFFSAGDSVTVLRILPTVYALPVNLLLHFWHSYIPYAILLAFGLEQ